MGSSSLRRTRQFANFCFIAGVSLALLAPTPSYATDYTWSGALSGTDTWATNTNWTPSGFPNANNDTATITSTVQADLTIDLTNSAITLNQLFYDPTGIFTVTIDATSGGTLTFTDDSALIHSTGGTLILEAPITINTDLEVQSTNGIVQISGSLTGSRALRISGSSIVSITGAVTQTGGTTIESNTTLTLEGENVLSGNINLDDGALIGSTNQTSFGILTVQSASDFDLGTGSFDWIFTTNTDTTNVLTIDGWTGDQNGGTRGRILFSGYTDAADAIAQNPLFLNAVQFQGIPHTGATFIDAGGGNVQLVPVPEPMTVFGIGTAGLGLVGWLRRRQSRTQPTV